MHGTTTWGLNVAASGWDHPGDALASFTTGAQTAGPSSKGGVDIQPLQVDGSVSFDDIGGLSEYIGALKEMAHDQLKAVLMTLLEESPSDLSVLLLGTSSASLTKLDEDSTSIFAPHNA